MILDFSLVDAAFAGGATCPAVSVSAVVDLFSKVLTELLPRPDQPPQPLMDKNYTMKLNDLLMKILFCMDEYHK